MARETSPSTPVSQAQTEHVPLARVWEELVTHVTKTPWLVRSLLGQGTAMAARVTTQYLRLRRLPRRVRRALGRRGALSLAGAALLLALAGPEPSWAGTTITVSNGSELATAITYANGQTGVYEGTNTLSLTANIAVEEALDAVTSSIVIAGNNHEIAGSSSLTASIFAVQSKGNLTLQETTVTGGKGDKGGALYNHLGTLYLIQSTLSGNTASGKGGALYNRFGTVILTNSTVADNSANSGGGLYNYGGHMTLTEKSTVTNNRANSGGGLGNGYYGRLTVSYSTVTNNTATEGGGILLNAKATTVTVTASTVSGNTASDQGGGGIRVKYGSVTVSEGSLISNNQGKAGGGLYIGEVATATIENSTVSGNVATGDGGGIYVHSGSKKLICVNSTCNSKYGCSCEESTSVYGSKLTVTYSTLADNTATLGGGIDTSRYTSVTLKNSTLSGNSASENGGGLNASPNGSDSRAHVKLSFCTLTGNTANDDGGGISTGEHTDLTLYDTLVSGNHAPTGREVRTNTNYSDISFGHNNMFGYSGSSGLSGESHGGSDIIPSAPLNQILNTTLANNGGYTETHALVSGSPAINAATVDCPPPDLDQRAYGRPASGSAICDIGAFEYGAINTSTSATTSSGSVQQAGTDESNASVTEEFSTTTTTTTATTTIAVTTQVGPNTPNFPALDLSHAQVRLRKGLVDRGVELVTDVEDLQFVRRAEVDKADRATFDIVGAKTGRGHGKLELRRRKGQLEGKLKLTKVEVRAPLECGGELEELESELVVSDEAGRYPSVRLVLQGAWECEQRRNGRVKKLEISQE